VTQTIGSEERVDERVTDVDPRIQARRDEVDRERTRRRRRWLAGVGAGASVLAVAWLVTHSPLLAVRRVDVVGTPHVPAAEVVRVAGIHDGQHVIDVDESAARARLLRLPWVATAHVDVGWGGTAHLSVTERAPVAAVAVGQARWMLADRQGRALGLLPLVPPGIVAVRGVAGVPAGAYFGAGMSAPLELIGDLHPGMRSRVVSAVVGRDGSLTLGLRPSGVAELCQPVDLPQKLAALTTLFAHVDDQDIAVVQACIADSPTVSRIGTAPATGPGVPVSSRAGSGGPTTTRSGTTGTTTATTATTTAPVSTSTTAHTP
jgi:cell division protein FtsQ